MPITLQFYADAGLTVPLASLSVVQATDGSSAAADRVVYLGSTAVATAFKATSNPGVDAIVVSMADSAPGTGVNTSHVKLAASLAGLASATAGAPLSLGVQIDSGSAGARAVHVRVDTPALALGNYAEISFSTNALTEYAS